MKEFFTLTHYYEISTDGENVILEPTTNIDYLSNAEKVEILKCINKIKKHKLEIIKHLLKPLNQTFPIVAVDIETTGLNPIEDKIRLISCYGDDYKIVTETPEELKHILKNQEILKVFHNATFHVSFLKANGYNVHNYTDTLIMSQIISNNNQEEFNLKALSKKYLGLELDKKLQNGDNWQEEITEEHKQYCLKDAEATYKLYQILKEKINDLYLNSVYEREIAVLDAVVELTLNGIKFDVEGWENELEKIRVEAKELENLIRNNLNVPELNLNSPLQLIEALNDNGINIKSTSDDELAENENNFEIIRLLRKYRKKLKLINTCGEKLKNTISNDGRIRGNWRVIGTDTFRMSCSKPNLQGMPGISKKYFIPEEGYNFVVADYSNIELRLLAEFSNDEELIKAFNEGEDLHSKTARIVLGKNQNEEITPEERKIGKTINFGLVYGITEFGLQANFAKAGFPNMPMSVLSGFINKYFETYKGVKKFQEEIINSPYFSTLGGRYWGGGQYVLERGDKKRFNYPIQASGSEGMKNALRLLMKEKKKEWKLVAVVHDEIVLEVPDREVDEAKEILIKAMKGGMEELIKSVPIEVEAKIEKFWAK